MASFITVLLTLVSFIQVGWAQIGYNENTNSLLCSKPGGHYCVHGSLKGPLMVSCISTTTAEIRSCNIELANILPPGHKESAFCYETAPILGDALCAFNGTGYPRSGKPIPIPETTICATNSPPGASDSSSDETAESNHPDPNADAIPVPRKRSQLSEFKDPRTTLPPRPDDERETIQTIPSLPFPPSATSVSMSMSLPTDSSIVPSTLTTMPKPPASSSVCVSLVRGEGANSTLAVYSTGSATGSVVPTLRRPKLADKCAWTPTPMYKIGAGVLRSSASVSVHSSSTLPESSYVAGSPDASASGSGGAAKTSAAKQSGAGLVETVSCGRIGFVMLLGWLVGWTCVLW